MPDEPLISVVLPTRGRADMVERLLTSITDTADRVDLLEIVLYLDTDDEGSHGIEHPSLKLVKLTGPRAKMGVMTRACFDAGNGQYVILLNDDAACRTPGWDTVIVGAFERFPDDIALVWCNDLFRRDIMPNFPAVSRVACELMGGICPGDYQRDYIDTHLFDVFRKLRAMGHDRLIYLDDVVIEHLHVEAGKADHDDTYVKTRAFGDELAYIAWETERQLASESLARAIREGGP